MESKTFRDLQSEIGCTGSKLAEWLGLRPSTISDYRNGSSPVPGPVALCMKALASGWRP